MKNICLQLNLTEKIVVYNHLANSLNLVACFNNMRKGCSLVSCDGLFHVMVVELEVKLTLVW